MTVHPRAFTLPAVRPLVQIVVFGFVGFGIGRWCIPSAQQSATMAAKPPVNTEVAASSIPSVEPAPSPSVDRSKSPYDRLCSAFKWRDPLGSAGVLLELIDGMTAEDFRKLGTGIFVPTPSSYESDPAFKNAFNDALVKRWLEVDPEGAAAMILGFDARNPITHGSGAWSAALARVSPESILTILVAGAEDPPGRVKEFSKDAFRELGKKDPSAARRFAEKLTRADQRKNAEIEIACGIAAGDPVSAVARARELGSEQVFREAVKSASKFGPGMLQQVLEASNGKFPPDGSAAILMIRYPELPWAQLAAGYTQSGNGIIFNGIESKVRQAAERLCSDDADNLVLRLFTDWTRRDAKAASDWIRPRLDRIAGSQSFGITADFDSNLVNAWIGQAPETALDYVREHPGTPLADIMLSGAVQALRNKPGAEKLALLLTFPEGNGRDRAMNSLFFSWIQEDRSAAFAGALSLPPGTQRDITVGQVLASWAQKNAAEAFAHFERSNITDPTIPLLLVSNGARQDPAATVRWLEKQSPDAVAKWGSILVSGWAEKDPVAAFNWALAHKVSLTDWPISSSTERMELFSKWKQPYVDLNADPPFASAIREKTSETLAWLKSVPAGPERDRLIETALYSAANRPEVRDLVLELPTESAARGASICVLVLTDDPPARETFAANIPPGPVREAAWRAVGIRSTEPIDLPLGPDRDAMLQGMVTMNYHKPERAWNLLQQINDPQRQLEAWDDVALILSSPSIPGYGDHLQTWCNLPGMPEEWKRPWKSK